MVGGGKGGSETTRRKCQSRQGAGQEKIGEGRLTGFSVGSAKSALRFNHGSAALRQRYKRGSAESTRQKTTYRRFVMWWHDS
jgi:hypothetical protein